MACSDSLTTLDPTCAALRKKGGFDKRFWIGNVADLDGVTYGTDQEVTAFSFTATKGFKTYSGKRLKHGGNATLEVGENANDRLQNFAAVLYAKLAVERLSLEQLADAMDVFIVAESNSGALEVFGINKGANENFDGFGLAPSAAEWKYGVLPNDDTSVTMTMSGLFENAPLVFDENTSLAANIIVLDGLVV